MLQLCYREVSVALHVLDRLEVCHGGKMAEYIDKRSQHGTMLVLGEAIPQFHPQTTRYGLAILREHQDCIAIQDFTQITSSSLYRSATISLINPRAKGRQSYP